MGNSLHEGFMDPGLEARFVACSLESPEMTLPFGGLRSWLIGYSLGSSLVDLKSVMTGIKDWFGSIGLVP